MRRTYKTQYYFFIPLFLLLSLSAKAGFLDMPAITESLELERKSMLRDLDIPGVKDRDPDPNAGPRLAVREFRVQGLVEYPELGITREEVNKLIEKIRFDLMAEDKLLDSGYTLEELGGLSDLLVDIEEQTESRHVTPIEVQKLVWLIRDQRLKRGITLGQIESIADKITKFYRERGFILAKAYIPKQEVREGIVTLTLLLGILGDVEVHNNKMYDTSILKSVFDDLLTKPVTSSSVEENLYLINDFPGISVNGFFEPGYQVGDTKLNINVKQEERFKSNLRFDNHGTTGTGLYRTFVDLQINNPLGISDFLNLSVLHASAPSNTQFWRVFYQTKLFSPRWKINTGISENQFLVDKSTLGTSLDLKGEVNVTDIGLRYEFQRSRKNNSHVELKYENVVSDLRIGDFNSDAFDESVNNTTLSYHFDTLNEASKRLHQATFKLTSSNITFGAEDGQDKKSIIFLSDYTLLSFIKVPFFESNSRIILRANLQYVGKKISSIARSALAGPTRVRGYSSDVFSADDAIVFGADWVFNSPDFFDFGIFSETTLKDIAKPFIFIGAGYGKQYSIASNTSNVTSQLIDAGFGLQFAHQDKFSGNLQFAFPVNDKFSDPDIVIEDKGMRVVFDFQYKF
ncbi:MAG: ShlB/FhaC/HecB family hemolysin secretion/activation protein [Gammaproteobacteria bacterium]|nr:ShlB/FhaC/HecB family hemolysin secretion/activation protein [Gammaproteobacteria bacterium]MCW8987428.1 ShlB/FhaC/HecB family hemolysin secretion/activation protein [Gammaproteobacteria bacterium]